MLPNHICPSPFPTHNNISQQTKCVCVCVRVILCCYPYCIKSFKILICKFFISLSSVRNNSDNKFHFTLNGKQVVQWFSPNRFWQKEKRVKKKKREFRSIGFYFSGRCYTTFYIICHSATKRKQFSFLNMKILATREHSPEHTLFPSSVELHQSANRVPDISLIRQISIPALYVETLKSKEEHHTTLVWKWAENCHFFRWPIVAVIRFVRTIYWLALHVANSKIKEKNAAPPYTKCLTPQMPV